MSDLEDTVEIVYTEYDLLAHGEPSATPLVSADYPGSDADAWAMPGIEEKREIMARLQALETAALLDVIERIQRHAYDGDYVFKLCRDVLGHE